MKMILAVALTLLPVTIFAQSDNDEARKREEAFRNAMAKIEDATNQLETFHDDLGRTEAAVTDLTARANQVGAKGDRLAERFHDLKRRDDEYGSRVERHDARCPKESDDEGLVASCNQEKEECDRIRASIRADTDTFLEDKDALVAEREQVLKDAFENQKRQQHDRFAIDGLERARQRFQDDLARIRTEALDCAKVLHDRGATCPEIKTQCGNIQFDGESGHYRDLDGQPCP
jgi:peptidoglycan hydrolase CwlO-like protein